MPGLAVMLEDLSSGARWTRVFTASPIVVGRDSEGVDLAISGPSISKLQGEISFTAGTISYLDHDSRNGSLVDGKAIPGQTEVRVEEASNIVLGGQVRLTFSRDPGVAPSTGPDRIEPRGAHSKARAQLQPTTAVDRDTLDRLKGPVVLAPSPQPEPQRHEFLAPVEGAVDLAGDPFGDPWMEARVRPEVTATTVDAVQQAGGTKLLVPGGWNPRVSEPLPVATVGATKVLPEPTYGGALRASAYSTAETVTRPGLRGTLTSARVALLAAGLLIGLAVMAAFLFT